MHGAGNDYVYVDCFEERLENPEEFAVLVSDRHKGIGADGLVLIMPSRVGDFRMRMFNLDGSEAQMCGNATRCVGKYVYDAGYTRKTTLSLETKAGVKKLRLFPVDGKVQRVRVDMGEPVLKALDVPVTSDAEQVIGQVVDFKPETFALTCVSMGNPHAVIFTSGIDGMEIAGIGRKIEHHEMFPERVNVEFAEVLSPVRVKMRVWERGSGETQACGTGACATLVAGVLNEILARSATVSLLGGELEVEWNESDNHVYMTGDAVTVFKGEIEW
ncbi:MAG: diaminopimelate epimerase [Odoribacteraceae bacterium]|nr:diaminopimelate epimerase [Odoribacteraceae bacterium]